MKFFICIFAVLWFTGCLIYVWHGYKAMQERIKLQKKMVKEITEYWFGDKD